MLCRNYYYYFCVFARVSVCWLCVGLVLEVSGVSNLRRMTKNIETKII